MTRDSAFICQLQSLCCPGTGQSWRAPASAAHSERKRRKWKVRRLPWGVGGRGRLTGEQLRTHTQGFPARPRGHAQLSLLLLEEAGGRPVAQPPVCCSPGVHWALQRRGAQNTPTPDIWALNQAVLGSNTDSVLICYIILSFVFF